MRGTVRIQSCAVAERLAEAGDLHRQVALLDDGAGPGAGEEILLRHRPARRLGERGEHGERPLAERRPGRRRGSARRGRVEDERTEGEAPAPSPRV